MFRILPWVLTLACFCFLVPAVPGQLQQVPPPPPLPDFAEGEIPAVPSRPPTLGGSLRFLILEREDVRAELEIVEQQIVEIEKLSKQQDEEVRAYLEQKMAELDKKLDKILLPHQVRQLRELVIRIRGTNALDDPDVGEALGLTESQHNQLVEIRKLLEHEAGNVMRDVQAKRISLHEFPLRLEAAQTLYEERVLDVLTSEQQKKWEELKGDTPQLDNKRLPSLPPPPPDFRLPTDQ